MACRTGRSCVLTDRLHQAADPCTPEDGLGDERVAEKFAHRQSDDGDDREGCGFEKVAGKEARRRNARLRATAA